MPLSQVTDRIKEFPGQALRAVFGGVGQVLMAADKVRSRLAEQLGDGSGPAAGQEQARPTPSPQPAPPPGGTGGRVTSDTVKTDTAAPAPAAAARRAQPGAARWRSLDKTGNVRLLEEEEAGATPATPAAATPDDAEASAVTEATVDADAGTDAGAGVDADAGTDAGAGVDTDAGTDAGAGVDTGAGIDGRTDLNAETSGDAEPAPEAAVGAVLAGPETTDLAKRPPAELAKPAPAELAENAPAELAKRPAAVVAELDDAAVAEPAPAAAEPALAEPAPADSLATPSGGTALPVAGYDELSVASLRARLRFLDAAGVRTLLEYEKAHQGRAAVITMFERRIIKLDEGS